MDDEELWTSLIAHRHHTLELLESVGAEEWSTPSLCDGWTVRVVAAHLTLQQMTMRDALALVVRQPSAIGSLNRIIDRTARRRATWPTDRIVGEFQRTVDVRKHNAFATLHDALNEILVHSQDIAVPLGRELPLPIEPATVAATHVWMSRGSAFSKLFRDLPLQGLRLVATDTEWSVGKGPVVQGSIESLLLLLTGRRAALSQVTGEGADRVRAMAA